MTEHTLRNILTRITFDNSHYAAWNFRPQVLHTVLTTGGGAPVLAGWHVRLAFDRPDTHTGAMGTGYSRPEFVSTEAEQDGVVKTILLLAKLLAEHEVVEAFHYGGVRLFDPHLSVEDLRRVQAQKRGNGPTT